MLWDIPNSVVQYKCNDAEINEYIYKIGAVHDIVLVTIL